MVLRPEMIGKPLLQLACRHQSFELICGAASSTVYGPTTGPIQKVLKKLIAHWAKMDKRKCFSVEVCHNHKHLATMIQKTAAFLQQWAENNADTTLLHDDNKLPSLSLLLLGNTIKENSYANDISVKAPGAIHNAR